MTRRPTAATVTRAHALLSALKKRYPQARCRLDWHAPHELLVATILSAQATDESVNAATPALFARFPTPGDYARATIADIEPLIRTIGLWRMKARAVHESMSAIESRYGGQVPRTMEELLTLRGVARKTANVVLGNCFGLNEGIVVDTHVGRLATRMGLTKATNPVRIERDLMAVYPRESWCELSHLLIFHGRAVCRARGNTCAVDPLCQRFCSEARTSRAARASQASGATRSGRASPTSARAATARRRGP